MELRACAMINAVLFRETKKKKINVKVSFHLGWRNVPVFLETNPGFVALMEKPPWSRCDSQLPRSVCSRSMTARPLGRLSSNHRQHRTKALRSTTLMVAGALFVKRSVVARRPTICFTLAPERAQPLASATFD